MCISSSEYSSFLENVERNLEAGALMTLKPLKPLSWTVLETSALCSSEDEGIQRQWFLSVTASHSLIRHTRYIRIINYKHWYWRIHWRKHWRINSGNLHSQRCSVRSEELHHSVDTSLFPLRRNCHFIEADEGVEEI